MPETKQINMTVPGIVHAYLTKKALKVGTPVSTYALTLFMAAYSARVAPPSGDRDLDAAVARVAILWAEERDTADIADAVGLSEATVVRVLDAWRAEVTMRGVA